MDNQEVADALDHAQSLGFIESWESRADGQVQYRAVRGFQGAGKVVVSWTDAGRYLAQEGLFDPETGETLTP